MKVVVHPSAELDLTSAFRFYRREAGAGVARRFLAVSSPFPRRFLAEFERVTTLLVSFPGLGTPTNGERRIYPLTGFPYSIIYRQTETEVRLLVVRHHSRDPSYGDQRT